MASTDYNQATNDLPFRTTAPDRSDLIGIALRGYAYIIVGIILGLLGGWIVLFKMPPIYKASSRIAFERTLSRYLQLNKVTNEPMIEESDTLGQIFVISSERVVLPVIRALALTTDPEFVGVMGNQSWTSRIRDMFRTAAGAAGLQEKEEQEALSHERLEKVALAAMLRNLSVTREDTPSVINVAFSSQDRVKAAKIVNAIVNTYLEANLANKIKSAKLADKVAQARLDELKRQLVEAENALLEYKSVNNLVGTPDSALEGPSHAFQFHLTAAQVAMAEAKARMDRFAAGGIDSSLVPDNDLISRLRAQLLDLSARANDIESRVGKNHPSAAKLRSRMEEIQEAIANEQKRLSDNFVKDYNLARARYDRLTEAMTQRWGDGTREANVRVKELEGAVEGLRTSYNRMLQQLTEVSKLESQPTVAPDAVVLVRADPPTQTEASKKRWLILAGGSFLGLLLGCSVLLASDFPFGVFRTGEQVSRATGLTCTVLPKIKLRRDQAALRGGEYALKTPYSRFAETLRSIWALINIAQRETGAKVICVVSSVPGEGKTTIATNLAAHFSCHTSARVLLIDADFHRHSLTDRVAPQVSVGLREALEEPADFAKFVVRKERLQLDVLPCPLPNRIPNAAELLGAPAMQKLIDTARDTYDLVVIEAPPMAAVVDFKMIARHCDSFIFVVEWGKTSQRLVLECLGEASELLDRVLCVVLNKADSRALKSVERYKGERFGDYYSDRAAA